MRTIGWHSKQVSGTIGPFHLSIVLRRGRLLGCRTRALGQGQLWGPCMCLRRICVFWLGKASKTHVRYPNWDYDMGEMQASGFISLQEEWNYVYHNTDVVRYLE